jgi:hypothetical protein
MLKNGDNEEHCYLDVPLALCRTNPAEVAVGDTLTCLVISSRTALVLKACGEVPGIYTRVGIFLPKSETWSFGDSGSIVIVWSSLLPISYVRHETSNADIVLALLHKAT